MGTSHPRGLLERPPATGAGALVPDLAVPGSSPGSGPDTPVPGEGQAWLDSVLTVYLTASEYLAPYERARQRVLDRDAWTGALLDRYPTEAYLCQLAALNHAATSDELTIEVQRRFLSRLGDGAASAVRRAVQGPAGGRPRWFLARQVILRAIRLVLIQHAPGTGACPDHVLAAGLDGIDLETAAVVLAHLAGDVLQDEAGEGQDGPWGAATPAAMDMIANNVFNDRDDDGDLIARYRMLWLDYGARLTRHVPRRPPAEMLREAAGIGLDDMLALACHYWTPVKASGPGEPVRVSAAGPVDAEVGSDQADVFLGIFASSPQELRAALGRSQLPWQMGPVQARPLLRLGDAVVVLDERYLIERVTRGLYWLVHDHEKRVYGDGARRAWTQVWGEMIEMRVEDQLRQMAPHPVGGRHAFFTEEDLQAAFPGSKSCDAGIVYGADVVLAEVMSGTVTTQTRELAKASAFQQDAEKLVLDKAPQLYETAVNLLRDPRPAASPMAARPCRILPVVIVGGQFPVNPLTTRYLAERLAAAGHHPDPAVQPLTVLDLEELEGCQALYERNALTLPQLLDAWRNSAYRAAAFRNYLAFAIGGPAVGRPRDITDALAASFTAIRQRFGANGAWPPGETGTPAHPPG